MTEREQEVKARPIIFSGPMVRALLDGRKTQTRRPIKLQTGETFDEHALKGAIQEWRPVYDDVSSKRVGKEAAIIRCPYGAPNDLLWVRETFSPSGNEDGHPIDEHTQLCSLRDAEIFYRADAKPAAYGLEALPDGRQLDLRWTPSIHMPRWASRLTLRITDIRVERVQEISERDARLEGVSFPAEPDLSGFTQIGRCAAEFADLWDSINAKRGYGWDANPWVWALTFEVVRASVDDVLGGRQ